MINLCKPRQVLRISTTSLIEFLNPTFTFGPMVCQDVSDERKDLSGIGITCFLKLRLIATIDVVTYPLHPLDFVGR